MIPNAVSTIRSPQRLAMLLIAGLMLSAAGVADAAGPGRPAGGPPGGPMASGGMVEHAIASVKDRLALNASQQSAFDRLSAQARSMHDQSMANRADVRAKVDAELAKPEPDLAAVLAVFDSAEDQGRAARRELRDQWLGFYASLDAGQKAIVRDAIRDRVASMDDRRQRMRDRMQHRPS